VIQCSNGHIGDNVSSRTRPTSQILHLTETAGINFERRFVMAVGSAARYGVVFQGREWILLLRGVVAIVFAVLAFSWPSMTQAKLAELFGVYALSHGLLSLAGAIAGRGQHGCMLLGTEGAVGILAGLVALKSSLPTPFASIGLIWLWAVGTGLLQIVEAIRLRKEISGDLWLALGGLAMLSFGFIVWLRPFNIVALMIARFALIWGIFEILSGSRRFGARPIQVG
jgi:uncharacterized membrane protein HdeD (DUF308 family)